MNLAKTFAARLKLVRKQRGLTQEDASERIGLTQSGLSAMETGKRGFTFQSLESICRVYHIHPSDLFLDDDYPALVITRRSVRKLLKAVSDMADDDIGRLIERAELLKEKGEG